MRLLNETTFRSPVARFLGEASAGCLMARLETPDAANVLKWSHEKIPASVLTGDGWESEVHTTVAFGFTPAVTALRMEQALAKWGNKQIVFSLGKIGRFDTSPEHDVLKVEVISEDLNNLHYFLREEFGEDLQVTFPTFVSHLTLAYVKKGSLPELDGHAKFDGETYVLTSLIFSLPESTSKFVLQLGQAEEQEADVDVAPTSEPLEVDTFLGP